MTDIKICDDDTFDIDGKTISICDEQSPFKPLDIKICTDDGRIRQEDCSTADVPIVSGDIDLNVGDIYTVSFGVPPYTWNFSKGTIDSDGEILTVDACGASGTDRTGVVSVTDSCGRTGNLTVRVVSGGVWTTESSYTASSYCIPPNSWDVCGGANSSTTVTQDIDGARQATENYRYCASTYSNPGEPSELTTVAGSGLTSPGDCCGSPNTSICYGDAWPATNTRVIPSPPSTGTGYKVLYSQLIEKWVCS